MPDIETIEVDATSQEAMKLTPTQRLELADRLVDSVGGFASPDVEKAWVEEAERRYQELKSGKESAIPAAQAIADAKRRLAIGHLSRKPEFWTG